MFSPPAVQNEFRRIPPCPWSLFHLSRSVNYSSMKESNAPRCWSDFSTGHSVFETVFETKSKTDTECLPWVATVCPPGTLGSSSTVEFGRKSRWSFLNPCSDRPLCWEPHQCHRKLKQKTTPQSSITFTNRKCRSKTIPEQHDVLTQHILRRVHSIPCSRGCYGNREILSTLKWEYEERLRTRRRERGQRWRRDDRMFGED